MTLSGDQNLITSTLTDDLKKRLSAKTWKMLKFNGRTIASLEIHADGLLDPFALVNVSWPSWTFLWQSKDDAPMVVAMGKLGDFHLDELLSGTPPEGLRFFSGLSFPGLPKDDDWSEFADEFVILPEVQWMPAKDGYTMTLRLLVRSDESFDSLSQRFAELFETYRPAMDQGLQAGFHQHIKSVMDTPSFRQWKAMVEDVIQAIASSRVDKVVLSRRKDLSFEEAVDLGFLLKQLSYIEERSYLFAFISPTGKAFLGRSPERLLSWRHGEVHGDAIAGTRKRRQGLSGDASESQKLGQSAKDLREHSLVADFVQGVLEKHCQNIVKLEKERVIPLKNVHHIRSQFKGTISQGRSPLNLLRDLHPTPAVGGCPTEEAVAFIQKHEPFHRGLFTGAVGSIEGQSGDFAIGIRSALIHKTRVQVYGGAGIVLQSDPMAEWDETEVKMKNFLDIFSLGR